MVIDAKEAPQEDKKKIARMLKTAEQLIDAELRVNAERLKQGLSVMVPCAMPFDNYKPLLLEYTTKGWIVKHEAITNQYGRIYFTKDLQK